MKDLITNKLAQLVEEHSEEDKEIHNLGSRINYMASQNDADDYFKRPLTFPEFHDYKQHFTDIERLRKSGDKKATRDYLSGMRARFKLSESVDDSFMKRRQAQLQAGTPSTSSAPAEIRSINSSPSNKPGHMIHNAKVKQAGTKMNIDQQGSNVFHELVDHIRSEPKYGRNINDTLDQMISERNRFSLNDSDDSIAEWPHHSHIAQLHGYLATHSPRVGGSYHSSGLFSVVTGHLNRAENFYMLDKNNQHHMEIASGIWHSQEHGNRAAQLDDPR